MKNTSQSVVKRLFGYLKPYKLQVVFVIIFSLSSVGFTLINAVIIGDAVDFIVGVSNVDFAMVGKYMLALAIGVFLAFLFTKLLNNTVNKICYNLIKDLREEAFTSITQANLKYIDSKAKGDVINRVINDIDIISDGLIQGFSQLFTGVVTIIATLIVMFFINYIIAIVVVVLTPLSIFAAWFISKTAYKNMKNQVVVQSELTSFSKERLDGLKTVLMFNEEQNCNQEFENINKKLYNVGWKAQFSTSVVNPTTRFINAVIYTIVGILGALFCINSVGNGLFTVGKLTIFLTYANQYTKPFNEVTNVITQMQGAFASASRVFEVIDAEKENETGNGSIDKVKGEIEIKNVYFSYSKDKPLIENFNLKIKAGSKVAVVGPTGCGKTTFINLLMRFYDVASGDIYVDGVNVKELDLNSYRNLFGMVLQESFLQAESVAFNIGYGKENATQDEIVSASQNAYCDYFINNLPQGYDTLLDKNVSVSQGQKQLLCISRLFLIDPPMLILDEATSNIDTMTEMRIQSAFTKLMKNRTSFIVAHRLSTILDADVILVMNEGKIVEQGTHAELLNKKGFYYNLYNSQFNN